MVTTEERTIEPIYIKNHDEYKYVCKYYPISGRFEEKKREEIGEVAFKKGYYVKNKGDVIGVFSSKKGPILFRNGEQYQLDPGKSRMELCESTNDAKVFRLVINGIEMFKVEYEKAKYVNFDPWSDEEMVDFYLWLTNTQAEQRFYDFYTES